MELVDDADTCHHGGAIGDGKSLADVHLQRCQAQLFHHLAGIAPFTFVVHFTFANQTQSDMGQLHQVATGTYATVHGNKGINLVIDKRHQQMGHIGMYARTALQHRSQAGNHG